MKFIINTTNLQSGGALQVAMSLLEEWNVTCTRHKFDVFLSPQMSLLIDKKNFGEQFTFHHFHQNPTSNIWTFFSFRKQFSKLEKKIKPDAILSVFGPAIWKPKNPHLVGFANGYYLFEDSDFIKEKVLNNLLQRLTYYLRRSLIFEQLKKEGTHYWVETLITQKKLATTLQENEKKITLIGNTCSKHFNDKIKREETKNPFTFLYLSAYYPHKNFEIIPKVIQILREKNIACQFILTLPNETFQKLFANKYCEDYLINQGECHPAEIYKLYQSADAVFMPSMLETFSANYPEAMKMKLPILSSNLAFAKDICGQAALYFDPKNEQDIAEKTISIIENKELQLSLIKEGQVILSKMETAQSRANKMIELLEELASKNK